MVCDVGFDISYVHPPVCFGHFCCQYTACDNSAGAAPYRAPAAVFRTYDVHLSSVESPHIMLLC